MAKWWIAVMLGLVCSVNASSREVPPAVADPAFEKRVTRLSEELRCLVCQNQTIADSNAELAVDLRNQVREQMRQGRSDDAIRHYMVERYGDFILYRPPVKASTALLWFGPLVLVVGGIGGLALYVRQRRRLALDDDTENTGFDDYDLPVAEPVPANHKEATRKP